MHQLLTKKNTATDNVIPFLRKTDRTMTILAVEDDRIERIFLEQQIKALGHETMHAANGREALDMLEQNADKIDVILMDRLMPVMDGLSAVWEIKNNANWRHIPIVMITSATRKEDMQQGLEAGVFYYLNKPADESVLRTVLLAATREAVQNRSLYDELKRHRTSFNLITTCQFTFRTLDEAECLAAFMAHCFSEPSRVLTGLAELLINAVEHGNLEVGYEEKSVFLENGIWRAEIERRLEMEPYRSRVAQAVITRKEDGVYIVITDQGKGFDWQRYLTIDPARAGDSHGRGIAQARSVSFDRLSYNEAGNQVVAFSGNNRTLEW